MADSPKESRIEAIQAAYQVGYMNEEVRISYKKDVKLTVGAVAVDAKEGDMSSLPRWVAKILAEQGAVEIQSGDTAGYISRTLNRERIARPHDLSGIDVDFYVRVNDHLDTLRERERENLSVSLNTFVASRLEKIVKLAGWKDRSLTNIFTGGDNGLIGCYMSVKSFEIPKLAGTS